jgi:hypothetical protein
MAKIYATLNDREMAFSWLERGLATGALGVFYTDEPVWDPIRDDPRFAALVWENGRAGNSAKTVKIENFFSELKRRNVYKVAITYAVVAWSLIQAASILLPTVEAPAIR